MLEGGLGNQLFGAALGLELNQVHRLEVELNSSRLVDHRPYALNGLPGFESALSQVGISISNAQEPFQRLRARLDPHWRKEGSFAYDSSVLGAPTGSVLNGYFQSSRYFSSSRATLQAMLGTSLHAIWNELRAMAMLHPPAAFAVAHIRRGDYLQHLDFHGIASLSYFERARTQFASDLPLIVVTDESRSSELSAIADQLDPQQILSPDELSRPAEVIALMAQASVVLMSNSSLSWWGAFAATDAQVVVAPRPWFVARHLDTRDLLEPSWVCMGTRDM